MRVTTITGAIGALALAVMAATAMAHPGHIHEPGMVHGFSWMELLVYLTAAAIVPVLALARSVHSRGSRRRRRD